MAKYLKLSSFPVVDYGHLSAPVSFTIDSRWADFTDLGGVYALSVRIQLVLALLSKLGYGNVWLHHTLVFYDGLELASLE